MSGVIDPLAKYVGLTTTREELPKPIVSCGTAQRVIAFDGATEDDPDRKPSKPSAGCQVVPLILTHPVWWAVVRTLEGQ